MYGRVRYWYYQRRRDLRECCREQVGRDLPDSMDIVGKLPETSYGKIDKTALRDPYW